MLLKLDLDRALRVAGEDIAGAVLLDYQELQGASLQEVRVRLRGSVITHIERQIGQTSLASEERIALVPDDDSSQLLWSQDLGVYPPSGSDVLRLPFWFSLPEDLLPSCEYRGVCRYGIVAYSIEVIGKRSGLRFDKKIMQAIPVLPASLVGAQFRDILRPGWSGRMRMWKQEKRVRRGIWGEYADAVVYVYLPDLDAYPTFVPIPITVTVETTSRTMHRGDIRDGEGVFPTPPRDKKGVEVALMRNITVKANGWMEGGLDRVAYLGGLGSRNKPDAVDVPDVKVWDKVWLSNAEHEKGGEKQKGRWRQEVSFQSTFTLSCSPSFTSDTMNVGYHLDIKVDLPGIGNGLKATVPLKIISSMRKSGWDGPPPELDLPPSYLNASDWDHDTPPKDEVPKYDH